MRKATFDTVRRLVADDPLTEAQIRELSGAEKYKLVSQTQAAEMLGVCTHTMSKLKIPRVRTNGKHVQYRLHDIYQYINSHTEL